MAKRYLRLTTEHMLWSNQVAEYIGEHEAGLHTPKMYAFKCERSGIRYVPESEAEFISAKEYFTEILKGSEFNDDV